MWETNSSDTLLFDQLHQTFNVTITLVKHLSADPIVRALILLCEQQGGYRAVAEKAGVSVQNLWQITAGIKLASGNARSVGPRLREAITAVFPDWLDQVESTPVINLQDNEDYPAIRRVTIKASAGALGFDVAQVHEEAAPIVFRREWLKKRHYKASSLLAMQVTGQSMEPTLWDGDLVIVNTLNNEPRDGVVFVALYEGETVVKRLMRDASKWWLCSDNHDQRRYARKVCHEQTKIVGEVVYKQSEHI